VTAARLIDGDLEKQGNITHYSIGDFRNGSMTWSSVAGVARPARAVFLRGDESEVESNGGCGEAVVLSWWRVRGSLREVRTQWSHSIRWSVVMQRHDDGGSRMAVVFSMWCSLLLSISYRHKVALQVSAITRA
jgi:hypothetical protein